MKVTILNKLEPIFYGVMSAAQWLSYTPSKRWAQNIQL